MPDYRAVDGDGNPRYDVQPFGRSKKVAKPFGGKGVPPFGKKVGASKSMSKGGR